MKIDPEKPLFPISTVAEILGCPQKALRVYEKHNLVTPARSDGQRRLYSQRDIEKLEFVHYLTHVRRVNLAGVKVILEILPGLGQAAWEKVTRHVEEAVEKLPAADRKRMTEAQDEVFAEWEGEDDGAT